MDRLARTSRAGFTLLELMISLAVLGMMLVVLWSTTTATADAKVHVDEISERSLEIRAAMSRIVRDLSHAYLSQNEDVNLLERRTLFKGSKTGDVDELRFSSLGHTPLWADANESEQTLIAYFEADDRKDRSKTNLIRRESRRLSNEAWRSVPAESDVLLHDVKQVRFEYFDWRNLEWKDAWDTTQATAERNRLPERVRITFVLENPNGDQDLKYVTQARLNLMEVLSF